MKLTKEVIDKGLELAKNALYMNIPLSELSHDELLAVAAEGWDRYTKQLSSSMEYAQIMMKYRY